MLNNYELPTFFWSATSHTKGKIIGEQIVYGGNMPNRQMVTYVYRVNDSLYSQKKKLDPRCRRKYIGSTLKIKYATNNPSKHEIELHHKSNINSNVNSSFFWSDGKYTEELLFCNDVVTFERKSIDDQLISSSTYETLRNNDTILFYPLLSKVNVSKPTLSFVLKNNNTFLLNTVDQKEYR